MAEAALGRSVWTLSLGDHPVADQLQRLDLSVTPIQNMNVVHSRMVMPMPAPSIGSARDYPAYQGSDAASARYTVTHPYGAPIDRPPRAGTTGGCSPRPPARR